MTLSAVQCFDKYSNSSWVSEKSRRKAALDELKELTKRGHLLVTGLFNSDCKQW